MMNKQAFLAQSPRDLYQWADKLNVRRNRMTYSDWVEAIWTEYEKQQSQTEVKEAPPTNPQVLDLPTNSNIGVAE